MGECVVRLFSDVVAVVVVVLVVEGGRVCRVWCLQVRNERW